MLYKVKHQNYLLSLLLAKTLYNVTYKYNMLSNVKI